MVVYGRSAIEKNILIDLSGAKIINVFWRREFMVTTRDCKVYKFQGNRENFYKWTNGLCKIIQKVSSIT